MPLNITHLTSVHPRYDTRIFLRECCSLARVDTYKVNLLVADGLGNEIKNKVEIFDVGKSKGRINRMLKTTKNMFDKAKKLDSDIYHFHDPELIFVGLNLKALGKKVIFDVHENTRSQINNKFYLAKPIRMVLSSLYYLLNSYISKKFHLVLAEKSYVDIYKDKTSNYTVVQNFSDSSFLKPFSISKREGNGIFYIGEISNERGLDIILKALKILKNRNIDFFMHYVGPIYNTELVSSLNLEGIENNIKFYGSLVLNEGFEISKNCKVGLSILKPEENMLYSYSTKIFEYMAVKLPVITSNFALYTDVIDKYHCGICINPNNEIELADTIEYIFTHKEQAHKMGEQGAVAVLNEFNWEREESKLLGLYKDIQ